MTDNELELLTVELTDLETALIFLREGKQRTENLKNDTSKQGFPDLDYRIDRIESAIDRFQARRNDIRAICYPKKEEEEANK